MSRIGKKPIELPSGVTVKQKDNFIEVKGPKGVLSGTFNSNMDIAVEGSQILVKRPDDQVHNRALHGLTRSLIANMVEGVTKGYEKRLQLVGVGYRVAKKGKNLILTVGYSHPVEMKPPTGIEVEVPSNTEIVVKGIDKQAVGQFAAQIRGVREPEPYKGKGIRYQGEKVRQKVGKTG